MKNKLLKSLKATAGYALALSVVISSLGFATKVQADEVPTLTIGSQTASNGATIDVPINATNLANTLGSMDFKVHYDANLLTYTGLTENAISDLGTLFSSNITDNPIVVNWFSPSALNVDNGTLLTLHFTIISAATTNTNLTFTDTELGTVSTVINPSSFANGVIYLNDTTPPTGTILINGGATVTNNRNVTLTLAATDDSSGVSQMQFTNGGAYSALEPYSTIKAWVLSSSGDGEKNVWVKFKDAAGRINTTGIRATIILDTTPPVITLNGVTPNIEVGGSYHELGATATDAVDGTFTATVSGSVNTNTVGTYTITYTAADRAGNSATAVTRTVNVVNSEPPFSGGHDTINTPTAPDTTADNTAPTGTIQINGGAAFTNSRNVTLTLLASDISGVTQMQFSGDGGETYSALEPYYNNATKTWTLTGEGDGIKTVLVKFKDSAGNVSPGIVGTITLDTAQPLITLLGSATVNLAVGDSYTDAGATAHDNIDGDITNITVTGLPINTSVPGTFRIHYNIEDDRAGNPAAEVTRTIIVSPLALDTTAPVITLVGASTINLTNGQTFIDPGVTATDNRDGNISSRIVVGGNTVNVNAAGTYTITYNVSDAAGNAALEVRRTVIVANPEVTEEITPERSSGGGGSSNSRRNRTTIAPNVPVPTTPQVLGASTVMTKEAQIAAIKAQIIALIKQLILQLQAEIAAQQ